MTTAALSNLTATWNASGTTFTAVKMNVTDTASAAGSLLLDLQVGGTSQFRVSKGGRVTALGRATIDTLTIGLGGQTAVASNTALGFEALNSASLTGTSNVAIGYQAGALLTSGVQNTGVGIYALSSATTGQQNTAMGRDALGNVGSGSDNSAYGRNAGNNITTGSRNTIIGNGSNTSASAAIDETVVGQGLTGKGDDTFFCGGTNGAYNEKNVTTWETTSDARIKKEIADFAGGLEVLEQVRVRLFRYRTPEEITDLPSSAAINQPGVQLGVIAQELQEILPQCVTKNSTGVLSVNTDPLIWYLIDAVKHLSLKVSALKGT